MKKLFYQYNKLGKPVKATIWFTFCNLVLKGISFITVPFFTRLLPDKEYGLLSIFISYQQLFLIFATWEIQVGAYQKGLFKYKNDEKTFTISTQLLINILTVVCFIVVYIFRKPVENLTGMNDTILFILFVYYIVQPAYNCWIIRKRTAYEYKSAVGVTLLYTIMTVIIPIIAIKCIGATANIKFIFGIIAEIIICLFFYIPGCQYWKIKQKLNYVKEQWLFLIKFEAPLVLHSFSYLILNQSDRVMIGKMVGNSKAAYYSVAYSLASVVSLIHNSINQSLLPWRYQMMEKRNYEAIKKVTNSLLVLVGGSIFLFILLAPEIMKILFSKSYYEAVWCIPPISIGIYFIFLYTIFVNIESYFEKTKYVMYVSVFCSILNICLNYVCIKAFGYIACGYTTMFSYIIFSIGHYIFMDRIVKEKLGKVQLFDQKFIICFSVILVFWAIIVTVFYSHIVLRYGIACIILLCCIAFRKSIFSTLKTLKI